MDTELRVELSVGEPGDCPAASVSAEGAPVTSVSRASAPDEAGRIAEEFTVEGEAPAAHESADTVAAYDTHTVYRFRRSQERACVCESVEAFGYPVSEIHATDGTLSVAFHAPDFDAVREIVATLQEQFSGVSLRKLTRTGRDAEELVFVDRSRLTARQREVLRTAHEMGYFDYPKGANAGEVAAALDISPSTFSEHLGAAQQKVFDAVLRG